MNAMNYNIKVAESIKKNLKNGQTKVVTMEEFAGTGKDFCEACKVVGLKCCNECVFGIC